MAKFCNNCNYPVEEGNSFCPECGSNDIRDTNVSSVDISTPPTEVQPPVTNPPIESGPVIENPPAEPVSYDINTPSLGEITDTPNSFAEIPESMQQISTTQTEATTPPTNPEEVVVNTSQKPKKSNKIGLIIGIVLGVIGVILLFLFILGQDDGKTSSSSLNPFQESDLNITDNPTGNTFDYSTIFTPQNSFRVGSKENGYVSIPNTWKQYVGNSDDQALHYTDDVEWMVSLDSIQTTEYRAYEYANDIYVAIVQNGGENVATSQTIIGGYPTLSIYAYYPKQKKHLSTWFLESENGYTHYLAIEGPSANSDNYNIIYSFNPDK